MRLISGTLRSTPLPWLPVLSNIEPPALRRKAATDKLVEKIVKHDSWPIQPDIFNPPLLRLTSRKPLWLDLQPDDIKSRWRHNWKSAQVVNTHLVHNPATEFWPPLATELWFMTRIREEEEVYFNVVPFSSYLTLNNRDLEIWVTGHWRSFKLVPLESLGTVSHSSYIITMAVSLTIYEIFGIKI